MEMGSSNDDDDDEDRRALVQQHSSEPPYRSAFEIGAEPTDPAGRRGFFSTKRCLLAVGLALLLLLLTLTNLSLHFLLTDQSTDRMRESELRALLLLRDQKSTLLSLWNRTANSNPTPPSVSFDEFRSTLLEQIKLNTQIQQALLSSHQAGNASSETSDDNGEDPDLSSLSNVDVCRKVDRPLQRRTIEWKPKKDRYLFAICLSGQMSNHLICLEKHMFFAALLGRVLVLPSPEFDYHYDQVLDIKHINECFGRTVIISFAELFEMKKGRIRIDSFLCYVASPPCYLDDEHIKRLNGLGIELGELEAAWPEDAKPGEQKKRIAGDIVAKFTSGAEILAIGDMFYADVEEEWVMQPGGPLAHNCKTAIQPSRLIILTAQRFVQTFLGSNFVALHFRRHGFLKFCNMKKESCFFPVPQVAECVLRVVERANAPVIYLSTDAAESETNLLQSLVVLNNKAVPLVKRPDHNSSEKWDALLYRNKLGGGNQVEAMLDKTICALSNVFLGSSGSTFTDDIFRLRRGWGSASQCDEYLCQGELPNYIAEPE